MDTIKVYNTHIECSPYKKNDYPVIERMYEAEDKFTGNIYPCGYTINDGKLYLPRGTSLSKLQSITTIKPRKVTQSDPSEPMGTEHEIFYEPRDELQKQSIDFLMGPEHQLSLNLQTGMGKGNFESTKIPVPSGWTTMGQIKPGDYVFNRHGEPVKVLEVFDRGLMDVYEIEFEDGRTARCSIDHLWPVCYNDDYVLMELKDMMKLNDIKIPLLDRPVEYEERITDDPYQAGVNYARNNSSIDQSYLFNSIEVRLDLLSGLFDEKATIIDGDIIYQSANQTQLEQIASLIRGFGYLATLNGQSVIIEVDDDFRAMVFTYPDKVRAAHKKTGLEYKSLQVGYITKLGQERCICIKVDDDEHLYLCDDFVVTHNTYCVAAASTKLGIKTIVVTPNEALKQQWLKTYTTMCDYRPKNLINVAGSSVMNDLLEDRIHDADVYLVNHQTLHSFLINEGPFKFHQFFKKIKVGIKVYDESHLEFANILMIDFFTNTDRTWYLTATFDRSDKSESVCFKRAFQSVVEFGYQQSREVNRRHVLYHVVNIDSKPNGKQLAKLMGYPGFTAAKYGHYSILDDKKETCYHAILNILKIMENVEGKILIFTPLIEGVDELVSKLKHDTAKSVGPFHSKLTKEEKEATERKEIIVSTIKSSGTGRDIKGLRCIICAEPMASKLLLEQTVGRLREYAPDKDCYYFDIVDRAIPACTWWFRARMKKVDQLVKEVINLNMD